MEYFKLNNGVEIPAIGLGTYPMNRWEAARVVYKATSNKGGDYTSFDTAPAYGNERWVGVGLKLSCKKRRDLFITTKLGNQQRRGDVKGALKKSLKRLNLKYIDLYLMHWPNPNTYIECYKQMEELYYSGLVRAIGVCNFNKHHLERLLDSAKVVPMVNQIEVHPLLTQKELISFCKQHNIQVQAYSPLARMDKRLIENKVLMQIAYKYNKTVPQVIFRWNYQCGVISVPKTSNIKRLLQNISIFDFELSAQEIEIIDSLNQNIRIRHDPDNCDFSKL